MESETVVTEQPSTSSRVLAATGPVLWIAASYLDPGKWAAAIEGGARLGFDLAWLVLIINCAAILCQYLSAQIGIATGKNLAQICSEEYDDTTCVLIGIEAEVSVVALDFAMVLGTAYGLHVIFGINIINCVFLSGFDVVVFPILTSFLDKPKALLFSMCLASSVLAYYFFGVLVSQPENSLSMGGMLNKLSGDNAYALMGLLGANIMPHNFYLHSSIVQQDLGQTRMSKLAMCYDHLFAIFCIFSGIFLVNSMLIGLAANTLYSSGLVFLTLQDALSLLDQVFWSSLASISLLMIIFFSNQLIPLTWALGSQVITQDLFRLEIPGWLHRATVRIIAIIPALYCIWNLGIEGLFRVLVFTQVLVALLLPSAVIPLFRVASSRSIMGAYKVSVLVEFSALVLFVGMLELKIVFVIEMIFGTSDWASNLKWDICSGFYVTLIIAAFAALYLMLLLATTPLKSIGVETQLMRRDESVVNPESPVQGARTGRPCQLEKAMDKLESTVLPERPIRNNRDSSAPSPDLKLPETLLDSESTLDLTTFQENECETKPFTGRSEALIAVSDTASTESCKVVKTKPVDTDALSIELYDIMESTLKVVGDVLNEKEDKPEESTKDDLDCSQSLTSEGPRSFSNLTSKIDEVGSGAGSLSRLAGLGRAARRQLTVILDEFWGQMFDFHGQITQEAKAKKLDVLLGVDSWSDSKSTFSSVQLENMSKPSSGYIPLVGGRGSDSFQSLSFSNSLKPQFGRGNVVLPHGLQTRSSIFSNPAQLLDAYMRNSGLSTIDSGERRYYSVRVPASSDVYDQQPETIHGYNLSSYLGQFAKETGSGDPKGQLESLLQNSPPSINSNSMDSYGQPSGLKPHGRIHTAVPPGFHNVPAVSRNNSLKSERPPSLGLYSPERVNSTSNSSNARKFLSLPDVSGLYIPQPDSPLSVNSTRPDKSVFYGEYTGHQACGPKFSSGSSYTSATPGSNASPSMVCQDAFSLQFGSRSGASSLWSQHPYEQLDKSPSIIPGTTSIVDVEVKLLQSFRICIIKLLKLEGSDWLFKQNDGVDEDIIARVATREKILYEVETSNVDRKVGSAMQINEANQLKFLSVPNCGEGCVWEVDLIICFGVWCIHRILNLSLMESRPELWGKYTYVLNRLQGIIDLAFSKPRSPMSPCFCLQLPPGYLQKPGLAVSNGSLPPPSPLGWGKFTTTVMLLEMIKDVEMAISSRKGRTGTAAGDVAFPKGKENLASVLKRYKRRLSNKPMDQGRKILISP